MSKVELQPVLLIEDERTDVILISEAFEKAGVQNPVLSVSHGDQALAWLEGVGEYSDRTKYPLPAFILLDLKLPGMNGLQLLKWIRGRRDLRIIPVVVLTSSADPTDIKSAYEAGANSYLLKPGDRREIWRVAELIQNYWLSLNVTPPLVLQASNL
ncbi:MAG TPA: response regulator [Candidatus Angelobacter sp.]|nr:response regulator [Candidatus Angelobacter sp.]